MRTSLDVATLSVGGRWPHRLSSKCGWYVGELGEDELYEEFRDTHHLHVKFCIRMTQVCKKETSGSTKGSEGEKEDGKNKEEL